MLKVILNASKKCYVFPKVLINALVTLHLSHHNHKCLLGACLGRTSEHRSSARLPKARGRRGRGAFPSLPACLQASAPVGLLPESQANSELLAIAPPWVIRCLLVCSLTSVGAWLSCWDPAWCSERSQAKLLKSNSNEPSKDLWRYARVITSV